MITKIYIGEDRLDLYKDENINLTSSVTSINDISKNTTDFTQGFTVPASEINNRIFKHYYDPNVDNTFDARVPVKGRIELDGFPFKTGKWSLTKVAMSGGNPTSYTINFTGNLVSIKDKLKDDLLSDLDLSDYDHEYNSSNVNTGLTSSLFSGDLVYSLFAKKQYYYNNDSGDNTNTPTLANIAWGGGAAVGIKWNDLNPSIRVNKILEAIETKYGLNFSNDFFGDAAFDNLFMWLNNGAEKITFEQKIDFTTGSNPYFNFTTDVATYPANLCSSDYLHHIFIDPNTGFDSVPYTINIYVDGSIASSKTYTGGQHALAVYTPNNKTAVVNFTVTSGQHFEYDAEYYVLLQTGVSLTYYYVYGTAVTLTSYFYVNQNLPKIKTIDFLKGLFSMFKLVVIANEYDDIYVNTLVDFYAAGNFYDITKYVDLGKNDVERGKLLNEISFKFAPPTTLLNTQFLANNGIAYGDLVAILEDEDGVKLEGEAFTIELPFEQIVYERLPDLNDNELTNVQWAGVFDAQIAGVNPAPHLYYNINTAISTKTVAFITDTPTKTQLTGNINIPSHTMTLTDVLFSTVFGKEFSEWDGNTIENTLYNNYYDDYINAIFNIKRRTFIYTAYLPMDIMTKLALNDVLKIKDNYYRIDNYNINLLNGETKLNLINSFDNTITV